jgi:hypothetical protein
MKVFLLGKNEGCAVKFAQRLIALLILMMQTFDDRQELLLLHQQELPEQWKF